MSNTEDEVLDKLQDYCDYEDEEDEIMRKYSSYLNEFDNGEYSTTTRKRNKLNKKIKHKKTSLN